MHRQARTRGSPRSRNGVRRAEKIDRGYLRRRLQGGTRERTVLYALQRLCNAFRIEIDFGHAFDLATHNGRVDLDRRGLHDVAPE